MGGGLGFSQITTSMLLFQLGVPSHRPIQMEMIFVKVMIILSFSVVLLVKARFFLQAAMIPCVEILVMMF